MKNQKILRVATWFMLFAFMNMVTGCYYHWGQAYTNVEKVVNTPEKRDYIVVHHKGEVYKLSNPKADMEGIHGKKEPVSNVESHKGYVAEVAHIFVDGSISYENDDIFIPSKKIERVEIQNAESGEVVETYHYEKKKMKGWGIALATISTVGAVGFSVLIVAVAISFNR